jgi:hypothetical protein
MNKGIWENYISKVESYIGKPAKTIQIDAQYSDGIWNE